MQHSIFNKITNLVCGMILCSTLAANAQEATTSTDLQQDKQVVIQQNYNQWSLFLDAGANAFDGDHTNPKNPFFAPTVGLGFVYNFNTSWGVGAEYLFSMHQVKKDDQKLFSGTTNRAHAFITFDIVNAWVPYNAKKIVALNIIAGAGAAFYNGDSVGAPIKPGVAPIIVAGADLQFNISKSVSLGLKGTYSYSMTNDVMDGKLQGTSNDGIWDLGLSVRYKLGANKKPHVNNENSELRTMAQVKSNTIEQIEPMIQAALANEERKRDTVVIVDTVVVIQESLSNKALVSNNVFYVYYDLNQINLNNDALRSIHQAAVQAQANEELYLEIVGYGDNTGSAECNKQITNARVDKVCKELTSEYGISSERIVSYSGGIIEGKQSKGAYAPNRRVEIRLINQEQFEASKQANCAVKEVKNGKTITVALGMTLGKIAKEQYGDGSYWTYIYEANKDILPNPDTVKEGQVLVIPEI